MHRCYDLHQQSLYVIIIECKVWVMPPSSCLPTTLLPSLSRSYPTSPTSFQPFHNGSSFFYIGKFRWQSPMMTRRTAAPTSTVFSILPTASVVLAMFVMFVWFALLARMWWSRPRRMTFYRSGTRPIFWWWWRWRRRWWVSRFIRWIRRGYRVRPPTSSPSSFVFVHFPTTAVFVMSFFGNAGVMMVLSLVTSVPLFGIVIIPQIIVVIWWCTLCRS